MTDDALKDESGDYLVSNPKILLQDDAYSLTNDNAAFYGAVFGTVLGGDNIIDAVNVSFKDDTAIELSGTYAQLIPVGGYVGAIENGGVIFRGMEGKTSGISGLPSNGQFVRKKDATANEDTYLINKPDTKTVDGETVTEYVPNMRWLYVNPIIGRVINGYAVTEASSYRPFEDGSRTYGNGDVEYWHETEDENGTITSSVDDDPTGKVGVTMRNGNKHYSITDINKNDGTQLVVEGNKITVKNAQAFFLMSLIVNSGISQNKLGFVTTDGTYMAFRRSAQYNEVGDSAKESGDYAKTAAEYRVPELTSYINGDKTKIANNKNATVELVNMTYYLPDGFKGIGNIFQNYSTSETRMLVSKFDGKGATISQNTSYYYYFKQSTPISPPQSTARPTALPHRKRRR